MASPALVAVTEHVPAADAVKVEPVTVQPDAVPLAVTKLTAPLPEPPLVVRLSGVPTRPLVEVTVKAACAAGASVTVVGADDTGPKLASPALVAVTTHVPDDVAVNVEPFTAQPEAVPFVVAKVTAPSPEPPVALKESGLPAVPDVEVTVNAAWLARTTCNVNDWVASGPLPFAAVNVNG